MGVCVSFFHDLFNCFRTEHVPLLRLRDAPSSLGTAHATGKKSWSSIVSGKAKLRDKYKVGNCIGQGGFGIVYECTEIASGHVFAVKMVDKTQSQLEDIMREADILKDCDHPCIMKFQALLPERCFVCIVSDLYAGGDLINAMTSFWELGKKIPVNSAAGLIRQAVEAIAYLHGKNVMHRDVKGDNYLMDRPGLLDPELRLVLSDFGYARTLRRGERLEERVGTKEFWAPQVYKFDYGIKADVWAAGVLMYGVLAGRFPFGSENAVMSRHPKVPANSTADSIRLLQGMLCKSESKRFSAAACLQEEYLCGDTSAAPPSSPISDGQTEPTSPCSPHRGAAMGEAFHNPAVDERRRELVERFAMTDDAEGIDMSGRDFVVTHKRTGRAVTYGWRKGAGDSVSSPSRRQVRLAEGRGQAMDGLVEEMLREYGVDTSHFGTGGFGSMSQFAAEMELGTARLMLDASDHRRLVRVVNVVVARISMDSRQGARFLVQTAGKHPDGRVRAAVNQFPGHKKEPYENTKECLARLLVQRLKMPEGSVKFDDEPPTVTETTYESPTYPGVCTVYHKEIVTGSIVSSEPDLLAQVGASGGGSVHNVSADDGSAHEFTWLSEAECAARGVALEEQSLGLADSVLIEAPIRTDEPDDLAKYLLSHGVDPAGFTGGRKGLITLLAEINTGMCALEEKDGALLRVVKVVLVKLRKRGTDDILLIVGEDGAEGDRKFPGEKFRPDENVFFAAKRFFSNSLRLKDENLVSMDPTDVKVEERTSDSPTFVGLSTVYRKYIITATFG